ncbi:MAG: radical SAM protein [Thermodesulfobacteriota bacterium]
MIGLFIIPRKNLLRSFKKAIQQPHYACKVFIKRFSSYITYLFGKGYSAPPETISLFLTHRCNLRCPMCGQWGEKGSFKLLDDKEIKEELSFDEIKSLLGDLNGLKPNITLFGGEPMLYKNWIGVVESVKRLGMRCNIVTNGVFLKKYVEDIIRVGLDEIIFSLDGPEEIHDRMRGVKGTFKKAMDGFKSLRDIKKQRGINKPIITINCSIYEFNYNYLEKVVHVGEEMGADAITFHHLLFLSKDICDKHNEFFESEFGNRCKDWYGFVKDKLPAIDVDRLLEEMIRIKNRKSSINISFYPNFSNDEIRKYYTDWEFESTSYSNRCLSLWMTAYIFPDGSVRPYHSMEFVPGNIKDRRFTEIWNCEKFRKYRRTVKRTKRFPVCAKGCTELYRY